MTAEDADFIRISSKAAMVSWAPILSRGDDARGRAAVINMEFSASWSLICIEQV